jgi:cysteine desulfurase
VREGLRIVPLIYGGIQEGGRRAGTENVPAIVGMGKAAELAKVELNERMAYVRGLRDKLIKGVLSVENVYLTGHPTERLPGHASFTVEYIEGESMLLLLASKGMYVASGSACSSKALKASPVLLSMGIPAGLAQGSIVFTLGRDNSEEDIHHLLAEFPPIIKRLREISPFAKGWEEKEQGNKCYTTSSGSQPEQ